MICLDNKVKIYTVGLGNLERYSNEYLKPLANNTGGAFYLAGNASELYSIYDDINKKIDIETDSDKDGISDYYEDNMVMFNGISMKLDKNDPDSDDDGIPDGQEAVDLNYKYNADKTKVIVTGRFVSNPLKKDTDGDLDVDTIDPHPLVYQLNDNFTDKINELEELAYNYSDSPTLKYTVAKQSWMVMMFIRQFNSSYVGGNWNVVGGNIDEDFVSYVKDKAPSLYNYFSNLTSINANEAGEECDVRHLAATFTVYAYSTDIDDASKMFSDSPRIMAIAKTIIPEQVYNDLGGWAGDLQTLMEYTKQEFDGNDSSKYIFFNKLYNNIGKEGTSFDMSDMYADTDAKNIYKTLNYSSRLTNKMKEYYKTGFKKRYTSFTNGWEEGKIMSRVHTYTKNSYLIKDDRFKWPLLEFVYTDDESDATAEALTKFLMNEVGKE